MLPACVLGAPRVCVWRAFDSAEARSGRSWRHDWIVGDLCGDDSARCGPQPVSEVEGANARAISRSGLSSTSTSACAVLPLYRNSRSAHTSKTAQARVPVLLGRLRRFRDLEDHFAGARQAHFLAGDALDGFGIALQRTDLIGERFILVVHL